MTLGFGLPPFFIFFLQIALFFYGASFLFLLLSTIFVCNIIGLLVRLFFKCANLFEAGFGEATNLCPYISYLFRMFTLSAFNLLF